MTVCGTCDDEMLTAASCSFAARPGVTTFGDELVVGGDARCGDCNVVRGGAHHTWCCVAWCEHCDEQRLCCGCDEEDD